MVESFYFPLNVSKYMSAEVHHNYRDHFQTILSFKFTHTVCNTSFFTYLSCQNVVQLMSPTYVCVYLCRVIQCLKAVINNGNVDIDLTHLTTQFVEKAELQCSEVLLNP